MKSFLVFIGIGLFVLLLIKLPYLMINPGVLAKGHQKLNNDCFACHTAFSGVSNEKCIACHNPINIGKDSINKVNKTLFHVQILNQNCVECHTQHQGIYQEYKKPIFKHEILLKTTLIECNGCHKKPNNQLHKFVSKSCVECHQTSNWTSSASFNHEELIAATNCLSCHQKPKDKLHDQTKLSCEKCHQTNTWSPAKFAHDSYFELDKNHQTKCSTCHTKNNYTSYTCFGCHEHSKNEIIREHNEEGIYQINDCVSCHKNGKKLERD